MQRTRNLKCVVVLTIILSLLISIGVAFFRGDPEKENGAHHHGHEKTGTQHHSHERSTVHKHNN